MLGPTTDDDDDPDTPGAAACYKNCWPSSSSSSCSSLVEFMSLVVAEAVEHGSCKHCAELHGWFEITFHESKSTTKKTSTICRA
uniref:Uncharacterized protein n=1 Tax=Oryza brachyantha TaxID=4533 RepID=J3LZP8_ORYBR